MDAETIELYAELDRRDRVAEAETKVVKDSLRSFRLATPHDYLRYLKEVIDSGNGHMIDSDWSNFMFGSMYLIDKDLLYSGQTYGSDSVSFLVEYGIDLTTQGRNGHETVYDMNKGSRRSISDHEHDTIPVPVECLIQYKLLKAYGRILPKFISWML